MFKYGQNSFLNSLKILINCNHSIRIGKQIPLFIKKSFAIGIDYSFKKKLFTSINQS